jgi:hypothetical protein
LHSIDDNGTHRHILSAAHILIRGGVIAGHEFTAVLGSHGADAREATHAGVGAALMWEVWGWHCVESSGAEFGSSGGGYDEEDLRVRGDRLIPPGSVDGPLALALAEVLHW